VLSGLIYLNNSGICIDFPLHFSTCFIFKPNTIEKIFLLSNFLGLYQIRYHKEVTEWTLLYMTNVADSSHKLYIYAFILPYVTWRMTSRIASETAELLRDCVRFL